MFPLSGRNIDAGRHAVAFIRARSRRICQHSPRERLQITTDGKHKSVSREVLTVSLRSRHTGRDPVSSRPS